MIKTINKYMLLTVVALASMVMAACSDDDDNYQKGVEKGSEMVYFDASNTNDVVVEESELAANPSLTLTISRDGDISKAISVPVSFILNEGNFSAPATVEFVAGSSTSTYKVDISGAEKLRTINYTLKIDDAYCNPYSNTSAGMDVFKGSVLVSSWKTIVKGARQYFGNDKEPYTTNDIQKLTGTNRFRIVNMYNSGYDIPFYIMNATNYKDDDMSTWQGDFMPLSNYNLDSWGYWWFDDGNGNDILVDYNGHKGCDVGCLPSTSYAGYNSVSFTKDKSTNQYYMSLVTYLYYNGTSWNNHNTFYIWKDEDMVTE